MSTVLIPAGTSLSPAPRQVARNGLYPQVFHAFRLRGFANHIGRFRTKHVASFASDNINTGFANWSPGDPSRTRWRCLYHSSPFARYLRVVIAAMRPFPDTTSGIAPFTTPSSHFINVYDIGGSTLATLILPSSPAQNIFPDDYIVGPENFFYRYGRFFGLSTGIPIDFPPDTDLHIQFVETPNCQTLSAAIYEEAFEPDSDNGYIDPAVHIGTPILTSGRSGTATILRDMWNRGASQIFNWSKIVDTAGAYGPRTIASATSTNLIDQVSTGAVTGASAGFIADLSNVKRLRDTGANVKVWVYGKNSVASNGQVKLLQSGGANVTVGPFSTGLAWVSGTGQLLANASKCDLQFSTASGTLTVEAVSVMLQD
jgi:hypothetical protein